MKKALTFYPVCQDQYVELLLKLPLFILVALFYINDCEISWSLKGKIQLIITYYAWCILRKLEQIYVTGNGRSDMEMYICTYVHRYAETVVFITDE